jgi:hypothetical protein
MAKLIGLLGTPFFDRLQDFADGFGARLRPEIAFAVDADADAVSFHVAFSITNMVWTFICSARWTLPFALHSLLQ